MPTNPYEGLNGEFSSRLHAFQQAANEAGFSITITSGYRSPERQQKLWDAALKKYGDPEIADNWVARPGKSHHGMGIASDLGFSSGAARNWAHRNAQRFGLFFPMDWEPWHIEPIGIQAQADPGAYTTPPAGRLNPAQVINDPHDIGTQFQNFLGMMTGHAMGTEMLASPSLPSAPNPSDQMITGQPEDQAGVIANSFTGEPI